MERRTGWSQHSLHSQWWRTSTEDERGQLQSNAANYMRFRAEWDSNYPAFHQSAQHHTVLVKTKAGLSAVPCVYQEVIMQRPFDCACTRLKSMYHIEIHIPRWNTCTTLNYKYQTEIHILHIIKDMFNVEKYVLHLTTSTTSHPTSYVQNTWTLMQFIDQVKIPHWKIKKWRMQPKITCEFTRRLATPGRQPTRDRSGVFA